MKEMELTDLIPNTAMQIVVTKKATCRISIVHTAIKVEHVTIESFDLIDSTLNLSIHSLMVQLHFDMLIKKNSRNVIHQMVFKQHNYSM